MAPEVHQLQIDLGLRRRSWVIGGIVWMLVVIGISLVASSVTRNALLSGYGKSREIREAQRLNERLLTDQLNEETAIRGYAAVGRRAFLQPLDSGGRGFAADAAELRNMIAPIDPGGLSRSVDSIERLHREWFSKVADPVLRDGPLAYDDRVAAFGKNRIDRMRALSESVDGKLEAAALGQREATTAAMERIALIESLALVLLGVALFAFFYRQTRLRASLQAQQATVGILQQGFLNRWDELPGLDIGAVYESATRGSLVGGDLFDVHRIDERCGYVLIADVSGKGVEAAIDTAFIKYSIRGLTAGEDLDPGSIVTKFSRLLEGHLSIQDNFVVLFLAIVDWERHVLSYCSAGHSGAFLRRGGQTRQLETTGPIVGLRLETPGGSRASIRFESADVQLEPDDLLILVTDGMTEARTPQRAMLGEEGTMEWIAELPADATAQSIADTLLARLRRYVRGEMADDLALLVLRFPSAFATAEKTRS